MAATDPPNGNHLPTPSYGNGNDKPIRFNLPGLAAPNNLTIKDLEPEYLTTEFLSGNWKIPCRARSKSRDLAPCKKNAIPGGTVCIYHGGGAPQVREKAAKRWALISHLAQERILEVLINDHDNLVNPKVLLDIAKVGTEKVELLEGRATHRTETQIEERRELLVLNVLANLDKLQKGEVRRVELEEELGITYDDDFEPKGL